MRLGFWQLDSSSSRMVKRSTRSVIASLDDLVGELLERFSYSQPKRPGGLQVNDELELGRLHDRKVAWLRAVEDTADVKPHLAKHLDAVGRVGGQTASPDELGPFVNRWDAVAR